MGTPKEILEHQHKYKDQSWRNYDPWELGMWASLLIKRSFHRNLYAEKVKDLVGARNYCAMLREIIDELISDAREQEHLRRHNEGTLGDE